MNIEENIVQDMLPLTFPATDASERSLQRKKVKRYEIWIDFYMTDAMKIGE